MGLLDFLSPALTVGTEMAGAHQQGQQQASKILQALKMQQANLDHLGAETEASRASAANSRSEVANRGKDKGSIHQAEDGTLYRVGEDNVAVPITIGGSPSGQPPQAAPGDSTPPPKPVLKGRTPTKNPAVGSPEWRQAEIDKARIGAQYGYHPDPQPQLIPGAVDENNQPTYGVFNKKTRAIERVNTDGLHPKAAGAGGGQNAPQMAAAKANMDSARQIMDDFEKKLAAGQANYGVVNATEGALASSPSALTAHGPWDALMSLGANAASSHLQGSNPELAKYMTAKKYIAEAILNTHKRPNQTQYEIEQELSGAGPNASPMQIAMGKERRDRMYNEVFANPNAGAVLQGGGSSGRGQAPPASATHEQQLWDAAVAKHGEAKVLQEYGPRP